MTHTFYPGNWPYLPAPHADGYRQFAPGGPFVDTTVMNYTRADAAGSRYGLGIAWYPLTCGGGYWSHNGDALGYSVIDGATPDGRRSAVVSLSAQPAGEDAYLAAKGLINRALCDTPAG